VAWTTVDSLNPPKATNRLINETGKRYAGGACVLYRIVLTCLVVDSTDGYTLVSFEDSLTDAGGTVMVTVPFQAARDTVELRFRSGLNFATGLGIDVVSGTGTDGVVMITEMYAQTEQA